MNDIASFNVWLAMWLVALAVIAWAQRKSMAGAGLVVAYALQLWVIHWLAAAIYALPWYDAPTPLLFAGLQQSTYAIIGFACGGAFLLPLLTRTRDDQPTHDRTTPLADPWLVRTYLVIGVASYVVQPLVKQIPSVGALASVASNLLLVAFAMECWNGIHSPRQSIWRWIALTALLPFITIITQGFLSYGFAAMLTVFSFVATIYRPRWKVVAWGLVVSYLALSVYVTYMRDRKLIRAAVWGQASYSERLSEMSNTFSDFEFLDIGRIEHLQRIDDRLNQNGLVGASVLYLSSRPEEFAHGSTLWEALISPIPRALWPDKPTAAGSGDLVSRFTGMRFAEDTSVGIGHVLEWYVNFGSGAVFFGSLLFGTILAGLDRLAARRLQSGDWAGFSLVYLPALSLLQVGGSLVEAMSGAGAGLVIGLVIHQFRPARLRRELEDVAAYDEPPDLPAARLAAMPKNVR